MARDGFVHEKAYGHSDADKKTPATTDTKYMAASITKQFAAAAALKLASRGLLGLDEKISGYFPELPGWKESVTVRSMMNHSSGIPDYFDRDFIDKYCYAPAADGDESAMSAISSFRELKFAPGGEHLYSNSGYVLLGKIIEKIARRPFADFAREELLAPAGMSDSVFLNSGELPKGAAVGYCVPNGAFEASPFNRISVGWADGNLCTTARDLYKWHMALLKKTVVSESEQQQAFSPLILPDGRQTGAGFGFFIGERGGLREIWHTGSTPSYTSRFSRFTDLPDGGNAAIILLCNADAEDVDDFNALFGRLAHILLEDVYSPAAKARTATCALEKISGHYASALDEELICGVCPEGEGIRLVGKLRGFKRGVHADYAGSDPDSGEEVFYAADGADVVISFKGDSMTINDIGRIAYLSRGKREEDNPAGRGGR
jgi:hypothetical protein